MISGISRVRANAGCSSIANPTRATFLRVSGSRAAFDSRPLTPTLKSTVLSTRGISMRSPTATSSLAALLRSFFLLSQPSDARVPRCRRVITLCRYAENTSVVYAMHDLHPAGMLQNPRVHLPPREWDFKEPRANDRAEVPLGHDCPPRPGRMFPSNRDATRCNPFYSGLRFTRGNLRAPECEGSRNATEIASM